MVFEFKINQYIIITLILVKRFKNKIFRLLPCHIKRGVYFLSEYSKRIRNGETLYYMSRKIRL